MPAGEMKLPAVPFRIGIVADDQSQLIAVVEGFVFDIGHIVRNPQGAQGGTARKRPAADAAQGGWETDVPEMRTVIKRIAADAAQAVMQGDLFQLIAVNECEFPDLEDVLWNFRGSARQCREGEDQRTVLNVQQETACPPENGVIRHDVQPGQGYAAAENGPAHALQAVRKDQLLQLLTVRKSMGPHALKLPGQKDSPELPGPFKGGMTQVADVRRHAERLFRPSEGIPDQGIFFPIEEA